MKMLRKSKQRMQGAALQLRVISGSSTVAPCILSLLFLNIFVGGASLPVPDSKAKAKPPGPHRDGDSGREAPRSCRRLAELARPGAMAPPLLPLLCGTAALLLLRAAADSVHCSPPKAVANAHIDAGHRTELNSRLRYSCNPGYKRKAGTSSLIQCVLWNGSQPRWTDPTLQCIRDPALSRESPGAASTTQRAGTTSASPNSSPSPAPSQSPVPPAPDGASPDGSRPPEMAPTPDTSRLGEGTTPLPIPPSDYAAVSIQSVASSVGTRQGYAVTETDIPMEGIPSGNEEVPPPVIVPTG
ncbi:interleukin-15 receptor subunit alpha [Melozone crissalis]|uniref:interleukin-15 receptor subunit alpha n=1 Tax=Melozone crissalis TaxID=40204 RepID=UPI0023DC8D64|nr:interleukin-15 receptor subunit alpha [Melozone crissalis]